MGITLDRKVFSMQKHNAIRFKNHRLAERLKLLMLLAQKVDKVTKNGRGGEGRGGEGRGVEGRDKEAVVETKKQKSCEMFSEIFRNFLPINFHSVRKILNVMSSIKISFSNARHARFFSLFFRKELR